MDSLTDSQIMVLVRGGEVERLGVLFERHHQALFNFFLRLTGRPDFSDDLVQEVFFRMLKHRQSFNPASQFRPWMFQIARNAHIDAFRKRRRETELREENEEMMSQVPCSRPSPDQQAVEDQTLCLLQQALAALPVERREVLILTRMQNLRYREAAAVLGCNESAVKARVHRALSDLRGIFRKLSGEKRYEM